MTVDTTKMMITSCPVCHYTLGAPFFDGGEQPLATLGWSKSSEEAKNMARHHLDYMQCPRCTHVWNRFFSYNAIPYTNNPNRMFNKGGIWQGHLKETRDLVISSLLPNPTVIDVDCGEGHFVRGIAEALNGLGRFMGFDPNATSETGVGVEFFPRYFDPITDIIQFEPDMIIMRHVLEHLTDPASFMNQLAWGASQVKKSVCFFAETPCIDKIFSTTRLVDFFYEHPSQFSTKSFESLMSQGGNILVLNHGYGGEVIYSLVDLNVPEKYRLQAEKAFAFSNKAKESIREIQKQIDELILAGKKVAIWGGTGKAAAFIHYYGADAERFPLVVDSDVDKVGTFVPKTGQTIQYRDVLKTTKVDVVLIPSQWRAKDIVSEMARESISIKEILIEYDGRLVDFFDPNHPYN